MDGSRLSPGMRSSLQCSPTCLDRNAWPALLSTALVRKIGRHESGMTDWARPKIRGVARALRLSSGADDCGMSIGWNDIGIVGALGALRVAAPVVFAVGWVTHRYIVARVTGASAAQTEGAGAYGQIIVTLGLSLILQNGGLIVFGSSPVGIRTPLSRSSWEIGDVLLNQGR